MAATHAMQQPSTTVVSSLSPLLRLVRVSRPNNVALVLRRDTPVMRIQGDRRFRNLELKYTLLMILGIS